MPPPSQKNSNITKDPPCGDLWSRYNCRKSSHKITMGKKIRSNHLKASRPFQGYTHYTCIFLNHEHYHCSFAYVKKIGSVLKNFHLSHLAALLQSSYITGT